MLAVPTTTGQSTDTENMVMHYAWKYQKKLPFKPSLITQNWLLQVTGYSIFLSLYDPTSYLPISTLIYPPDSYVKIHINLVLVLHKRFQRI